MVASRGIGGGADVPAELYVLLEFTRARIAAHNDTSSVV